MTPTFSFDNITNRMTGNAVILSHVGLICFAIGVSLANFNHFCLGKFGVTGLFAADLTVFGAFVLIVVHLCAKKKMGRVCTWWIIAGVADERTIWDWPVMQLIRESMNANTYIASKSKNAVTARARGSLPIPASIGVGAIHFPPKTLFDRLGALIFSAMPINKSCGLTFYMAFAGSRLFGNRRELSAATFAEFKRGLLRGMIHDVIRSFQRLTMPRDTDNVAVALLLVNSIIPKEVVSCHF